MDMNISLPPQMQRFLEAEVKAGRYATTSEAVRDGIRLLQERKAERAARLVELRNAVAVGIAQADRGETAPLNLEDVLAKVRAKRRGGQ
jgi:antitoxin ParD1/3/4